MTEREPNYPPPPIKPPRAKEVRLVMLQHNHGQPIRTPRTMTPAEYRAARKAAKKARRESVREIELQASMVRFGAALLHPVPNPHFIQ